MRIEAHGLYKKWGNVIGLDDVSVDIASGELVALLGPSGSGKTTLLRILGGLEQADAGTVRFGDQDATKITTKERGVGFVFQHYALFRHMSVFENVAFGLRVLPKKERPRETEIYDRVHKLLGLVQLEGLSKRLPSQLSGGQRQRVALARALAVEPRVLLLDEPFGALDAKVREELRRWLRSLHDELHVTSVFVTHDQQEALEVADRVVVLNHGRIQQIGTPNEVLDEPSNAFVNEFVGEVNVLKATIEDGRAVMGALSVPSQLPSDVKKARVMIRVYELKVWKSDAGIATVERKITLGDRVKLTVSLDGVGPILAQFPRRSSLLRGVEVGSRVAIEVTRSRVYPA